MLPSARSSSRGEMPAWRDVDQRSSFAQRYVSGGGVIVLRRWESFVVEGLRRMPVLGFLNRSGEIGSNVCGHDVESDNESHVNGILSMFCRVQSHQIRRQRRGLWRSSLGREGWKLGLLLLHHDATSLQLTRNGRTSVRPLKLFIPVFISSK